MYQPIARQTVSKSGKASLVKAKSELSTTRSTTTRTIWQVARVYLLIIALAGSAIVPTKAFATEILQPTVTQAAPTRNSAKPSAKPQTANANASTAIDGIATKFINPAAITIPDVGTASPYPAIVNVTGFSGTVTAVSVSFYGLAHRYTDDVDILLVGPGGQSTIIMADIGENVDTSNNPVDLTFADSADLSAPATTMASGVYKPTNYNNEFCAPDVDDFPAPAPAPNGTYSVTLDIFNGLNPNGVWSLYVVDDCGSGDGIISGGWSLELYQTGSTTANSGGGQSTPIETPFPLPLVATVKDGNDNPVSSQAVFFAAPASGASGTFANGANVYTGITDANGVVTSTAFTANNVAGSYNVTARAGTLASPAYFAMSNTPGAAAGASVITGSNQAATSSTSFKTALVAQLTDSVGNAITGTAVVTFTATLVGASGSFAGGSNIYTGTTDASGVITAPAFTANNFAGRYVVTATSGTGATQANFILSNQTDTTADRVYGQNASFITNTKNNGGISATSLNFPSALVVDSNGGLYVTDLGNNRILYYPAGSTTATRVYGQNGSFITNTANLGGVSANSLDNPDFLALDSSGGLYVSDFNNSRVLYYPAGSTTATRVYGQDGSFTTKACNTTTTTLCYPEGLALDSNGGLYVADTGNNRILYYPAGSTTATRVYGQNGNFNTRITGTSAQNLRGPVGLGLDSSGGLYSTEYTNYRMLYFANDGDTIADRVYGQAGSFTSAIKNNGGVSANSLEQATNIVADSAGNIYVADFSNHRVLFYSNQAAGSLQLEKASYAQYEGNSVVVTVTRTGGSTLGAVANITATGLSADASEYSLSPNLLSWPAGDSSPKTVTVTLNSDAISESVEKLNLTLASYNGGINLGNITTATVSILDAGCSNYLLVTSTADDGSCGSLRAALSAAGVNSNASAKQVTITLPASSTISLGSGLTLESGVSIVATIGCIGEPPITLLGSGNTTDTGLTLLGQNSISGLWVKGFGGKQVAATTSGGSSKLTCFKAG